MTDTLYRDHWYESPTITRSRTDDLIDAIEAITAASYRLAVSSAAETHRSFECPAANPLNERES